ncbi:M28 family peptidase [Engelhardtia mirabilis]
MRESEEAFDPRGAVEAPAWHRGPGVVVEDTGPARFVPKIHGAFDPDRAFERVRWMEAQYRAPGNDDYEAAMDRLIEELEAHGFVADGGSSDATGPGDSKRDRTLELRVIETPVDLPAWNPISGSLTLEEADGEIHLLHGFDDVAETDRTMLPINGPAGDVSGPIALSLDDLRPGDVLVTEVRLPQVVRRAEARGAVAVVSSSLGSYNVDPTGADRHLDAIQYRQLHTVPGIPVCQISQRSLEVITAATARGGAQLHLKVEVEFAQRPLRTLVAVVVGRSKGNEVMGISAHLHEPGANDNSSGVATLMECAVLLADGIKDGSLRRPDRSIAFIWGHEFQQTAAFLDNTERTVVAGISADMTGESLERTGAIALLERMPDPGALITLPPDEHSAWGAGDVTEDKLVPSGLAVIARCAMIDVGLGEGGWESADHPWEGGSDHDVYLAEGVPAVLFWHFTDFAYHTSLDRLEMVDPLEMRRMGSAILGTAMAVAAANPGDLDRYVRSVEVERSVRVKAAREAFELDTAQQWESWSNGARSWLRRLCLGLTEDEAEPFIGR